MACNCGKSREQRTAELEARRVRLEELRVAKQQGKVGPGAPGYFHQSASKTA